MRDTVLCMIELNKILKDLDENGWVDSRALAYFFGRRASDLNRDIRNLQVTQKFKDKHFKKHQTKGTMRTNRNVAIRRISHEGVTFLIMMARNRTKRTWRMKEQFIEHMFNGE